jgi:cytochrome c
VAQAAPDSAAALSIVQKNNCLSCHAVDSQVVGPAYREIAKKYHGDTTAPDKLFAKVRNGGAFVWGEVPMPANPVLATPTCVPSSRGFSPARPTTKPVHHA